MVDHKANQKQSIDTNPRKKQLVDPHLLDKIDKLTACQVGNDVPLPQLVVVGAQSSGKSSVLEALTGLPFPRDAELCTCFATSITFRRADTSGIKASITPNESSSEQHKKDVADWKPELKELEPGSFAKIMREAIKCMGVRQKDNPTGPAFSKDVLNLEIRGPEQQHFAIVDVPGLFRRVESGVTTTDDILLVEKMVTRYMESHRSILLVVVPANVDIATQEIVEKAEEIDPEGIRTLGILTKPDRVEKGAETPVLDIMKGKRQVLALGWHMLRNAGPDDMANWALTRNDEEEKFFRETGPWNELQKGNVGVSSLSDRLQEILAKHLRREFPKVKTEIGHKLLAAKADLSKLGQSRQTQVEQAHYLTERATFYRAIADAASRGDYTRDGIFADSAFRLATKVVNRSVEFSDDVWHHGHTFQFQKGEWRPSTGADAGNTNASADDLTCCWTRRFDDSDDIKDLLLEMERLPSPSQNTENWLEKLHRESRGYEIGTFPAQLLGLMMKEQAKKWRPLAHGYVSDVICAVHDFMMATLVHAMPMDRNREALVSYIIDPLRKCYEDAIEQTTFLLDCELSQEPATHNHYFNDELEKCRQIRLKLALEAKSTLVNTEGRKLVRVDDVCNLQHFSNEEHTIREIHDILRAYYKVARKRFVDNVRILVVDRYLVKGPKAPLKIFSPLFVADLRPDVMDNIAGEEIRTRVQREQLTALIKRLEEGRDILRG